MTPPVAELATAVTRFAVDKSDLRRTCFAPDVLPALQDGEALLEVDRFAFTANNVTYAELGERLGYWQHFPAPPGLGVIPVYGFAEVAESRHPELHPGERIYGFLPMATHVVLRPVRVAEGSFVDGAPHRSTLPSAYNLYLRCAGDPQYQARYEDLQALLRPLFITSFLLDDWLADERHFGAQAVLLASASSKTALGLAFLLHRRRAVRVVGLTSARNAAFLERLGCYDRIVAYDAVAGLSRRPSVLVDFAGSAAVRAAVHDRLGDSLHCSCSVGLSHRELDPAAPRAGPQPAFFFAPERLRQRARDWGRDGLDARLGAAWRAFVPAAAGWFDLRRYGRKDVAAVYRATLEGRVPASRGQILSLK